MTKIYTNALLLSLLATLGALSFAAAAGGGDGALQKAAFIFGMALAGGFLSVGMTFAGRPLVNGRRRFSPLNCNVLLSVLAALVTLGGLVALLEVSVYTDMVAEGIASSVAGSIAGIIMAFAKADDDGKD